jgi:hypothetical protein
MMVVTAEKEMESMHATNVYRIEVQGQVDEGDINAMSPFQMTVERADTAATLFTVHTDQSGLIGLMRHLHGRGIVFLAVTRVDSA